MGCRLQGPLPLQRRAQKIFITYEDEESVRTKARYVLDRGLAGIMFWELSEDPEGKLLDAINGGVIPAEEIAAPRPCGR